MPINITLKIADSFIDDLLSNLPEYAKDSFRCTRYDYKECMFCLVDIETNKPYILTREKAIEGLQLFATMVIVDNSLPGLELNDSNMFDVSNWGSYDMDAYLQVCLLGEVIYG